MTGSTNVVKVTMSKYYSTDFMFAFFEISYVWHNVVYTWVVSTWEQKAHVDYNNVVIVFDSHHVFANTHFAKSADWDYLKAWRPWCRLLALTFLIAKNKLLAPVAVVDRLVNRHINNMLASHLINVFAGTTSGTLDFATPSLSFSQYTILWLALIILLIIIFILVAILMIK